MVTLTYASITARKSIRYFIYFIIFLVVGRIMLNGGIALYKKIFPPAPEPADVAFGKLSKLPFPEQTKPNLTFTLETPTGDLPTFPFKTNVYFMPRKSANLLSLDYTKSFAKKLGYDTEPQQISNSVYKFKHKTSLATLTTDIITSTFSISYDLTGDPSPISVHPNQPEIAATMVKSFLNSAGLLSEDLGSEARHRFLKVQSGGFIPATSLSDANLVRIDLFRNSYNDLPVVTKNPLESNVWFVTSGIREKGRDIIAGEYHYFPVDKTKLATYQIKTSDEAWQELTSNSYFLARLGTNTDGGNVKIRKIYLAYYDAGIYTEYLQPIYVFEGDKEFVGYIPAITSDYYGE